MSIQKPQVTPGQLWTPCVNLQYLLCPTIHFHNYKCGLEIQIYQSKLPDKTNQEMDYWNFRVASQSASVKNQEKMAMATEPFTIGYTNRNDRPHIKPFYSILGNRSLV